MLTNVKIPVVVIVDAHSTGRHLADRLMKDGVDVVHIQSSDKMPSAWQKSFRPEEYSENFVWDGKDGNVIDQIRQLLPIAVIAGAETGVYVCDIVARELGLPGNDPKTSDHRRNKFEMNEAVRRAGMQAVKQVLANSIEEALKAYKDIDGPVIVKPLNSAGSEDVYRCETEKSVAEAFKAISNKVNFLLEINSGVLVQELLVGEQYVVNAVSASGKHRITEIYHDKRLIIDGGIVYDREILLEFRGDIQDILVGYMKSVLNAIGLEEGASHSEVMLTNKGPVLIEVGARLQGGISTKPIEAAIGQSHLTVAAELCLNRSSFVQNIGREYYKTKECHVVNLISPVTGTIAVSNVVEYVGAMQTCYEITSCLSDGDTISKTVDLFTKAGHIYLVHHSFDAVEHDYNLIRSIEDAGGFYVLE